MKYFVDSLAQLFGRAPRKTHPDAMIPEVKAIYTEKRKHKLTKEDLRALEAAQDAGSLEATPGLRTQLRMLVEESDDEIAGMAEDLLEAI